MSKATRASLSFEADIKKGDVVLVEASVRIACSSLTDGGVRRLPVALLDACLEPGYEV